MYTVICVFDLHLKLYFELSCKWQTKVFYLEATVDHHEIISIIGLVSVIPVMRNIDFQ